MLYWSQGLFGFVGPLSGFVDVLAPYQVPISSSNAGSSTPPQTPPIWDGDLTIPALMSAYRAGLSPVTVIESLYKKIQEYQKVDPAVWIYLEKEETVLTAVQALLAKFPDRKKLPPLFGVPFSIKDSIDIKGIATTTACPPLAFIPEKSALVYEKCIAEGALFIGKTNLDQLATGLSGCRSPYGITKSVFTPAFISGGSSSGNAVSVGAKLVSFSLATDTAGSGRVPAGFNGTKPPISVIVTQQSSSMRNILISH
jgi:Asp-tRNA(Asn)/Glu-tRNA(Gln) amidotransferase A subunit family amidase